MFINEEPFLGIISSYRLVWIGGRVGGHKTSLAYMIARSYLEKGYRLITNNRCVWADNPEKVELDKDGHLKAVVVLDEGGLYFKSSRQVEMIASYPAKMDVIYLIPSFWPPVRTAQILTCQPLFNLKSAGLPVIVYRWRVKVGAFEDKGHFLWINPSEIYGVYSRQDPGEQADKIISWLVDRTELYRRSHGRDDSIPAMETELTEADQIADSAAAFAEAADTLASIPIRKYKRR